MIDHLPDDSKIARGPRVTVIAATRFRGVPAGLSRNGVRDDQDQGSDAARLIECAGRACYDSYSKGRSSAAYHDHIREVGHGSVLEHASISFYIEGVSRGLTHELVRHRHAAISQRSTRYVDESQSEIAWHPMTDLVESGSGDGVERHWLEEHCRRIYCEICADIEALLIERGVDKIAARKQARGAARGALPTALSTSLVWTVNVRALRQFLEQRASPFADAEIRLLANRVFEAAQEMAPEWVSDYRREDCADGIGYALTTEFKKL